MKTLKFVDLFCGIGGFRMAAENVCRERALHSECVFSCDIDADAQQVYQANFGDKPCGDVTMIEARDIPDHDLLFAGFPCQAFSICGDRRGFEDARGTLFFDIARILQAKQPSAFILENVKQLRAHDEGRTLRRILETLKEIGYFVDYKILNALDFGLPQKRERIFIIGFRQPRNFAWASGNTHQVKTLSEILERDVSEFYFASEQIKLNRLNSTAHKLKPDGFSIWHENKGGNISPLPYSCALRAGASYNYLLVNGERRLTEREMLRLQGFPDSYQAACSYQAMRKLAGNSVAIPCVEAVMRSILSALVNQPSSVRVTNKLPSHTVQNFCEHLTEGYCHKRASQEVNLPQPRFVSSF